MIFGLGKHGPDARYGAVIDIGSGSVGVAIVVSDPTTDTVTEIWSKREYTKTTLTEHDDAKKRLLAAFVSTTLALGSEGQKALIAHDKTATIDEVQVVVSAPWSYTITRSIVLNRENPFTVSQSLINELVEKAKVKIQSALQEEDLLDQLKLTLVDESILSVRCNDYVVTEADKKEVRKLEVTLINCLVDTQVVEAVRETIEKIAPKATLTVDTFMYQYYQYLKQANIHTTEACLVDVTAEATELAIVRDGELRYVTHVGFGSQSLVRALAGAADWPPAEALSFIRSNEIDTKSTLGTKKQTGVEKVVTDYQKTLTGLFSRSGDSLSIPKTIFMHTDRDSEAFFSTQISASAKAATAQHHAIHPITSEFFASGVASDTALLLSTAVFHKKLLTNSVT